MTIYPVAKYKPAVRVFGKETINIFDLKKRIGILSAEIE